MSEVAFYPMEADGASYPGAAVPLLPSAPWPEWCSQPAAGSAFLGGGETFTRGRYALAEAMHRAGAQPGTRVLLPAFHCRAVVEPALHLGAQPCFYPVNADLRPDFPALSSLAGDGDAPVAAMVLTHYFGFPNDLDEAERFCAAHGIALIEDCAHALYGRAGARLLGTVGRYAAASIWKFLPVRDGALLLDNTGAKPSPRPPRPMSSEARPVAALLQGWLRRAWQRHGLPAIDARALCEQARLVAARARPREAQSGLKVFSPGLSLWPALRSTGWILAHSPHERIASHRRGNYLQWLEGMRSVAGAKPLFPHLPEGVVPYAFPLLIDDAGMGFHRLRMAGIPFWRWEDMAVTDCAVSRAYRIRLLQLPCHQELRAEELGWMIRAVQTLLAEPG